MVLAPPLATGRLHRGEFCPVIPQKSSAPSWRQGQNEAAGGGGELKHERVHGTSLYARRAKSVCPSTRAEEAASLLTGVSPKVDDPFPGRAGLKRPEAPGVLLRLRAWEHPQVHGSSPG